jgi:hypothetical protein
MADKDLDRGEENSEDVASVEIRDEGLGVKQWSPSIMIRACTWFGITT